MAETTHNQLPEIPSKRYFTIGEVAELCDVRQHVLRYWEQEFPELKPTKRRGNRRYYQRADIELIRQIRELLYGQGFTIAGARQQLGGKANDAAAEDTQANLLIRQMRAELEDILQLLSIEHTGNKERRAALSLIKS
ncbi:MAG: MerR family transcriptional regulator [Gammaproteobacteria bacterium]|nr:MerR family transcriptional regulator [Gammaproteobacteria bacterium]